MDSCGIFRIYDLGKRKRRTLLGCAAVPKVSETCQFFEVCLHGSLYSWQKLAWKLAKEKIMPLLLHRLRFRIL